MCCGMLIVGLGLVIGLVWSVVGWMLRMMGWGCWRCNGSGFLCYFYVWMIVGFVFLVGMVWDCLLFDGLFIGMVVGFLLVVVRFLVVFVLFWFGCVRWVCVIVEKLMEIWWLVICKCMCRCILGVVKIY